MENIRKKVNLTITNIIIAINILVYVFCAVKAANIVDIPALVLYHFGANCKFGVILYHQYYRLFTCMFLHAGIIHLACNMYSLYFMGNLIEKIYGKIQFLIIYIISGIGCSILSLAFADSIITVSVGASGAIFGLFGAFLFFAIKERNRLQKSVINNIAFVIIINLVLGASSASIDNYGHIGGLITGILLSIIIYYINLNRLKRINNL